MLKRCRLLLHCGGNGPWIEATKQVFTEMRLFQQKNANLSAIPQCERQEAGMLMLLLQVDLIHHLRAPLHALPEQLQPEAP